ncbi:MAG: hypothetical protein U0401_09615 [Anaerolineae bacterium]
MREISSLHGWGELPPLLEFNGLANLKQQDFWQSLYEQGIRYREERDRAFTAFSERGGYPIAQARTDRPWEEIADQLNETVIRRVIRKMTAGGRARAKKRPAFIRSPFSTLLPLYSAVSLVNPFLLMSCMSGLEGQYWLATSVSLSAVSQ